MIFSFLLKETTDEINEHYQAMRVASPVNGITRKTVRPYNGIASS